MLYITPLPITEVQQMMLTWTYCAKWLITLFFLLLNLVTTNSDRKDMYVRTAQMWRRGVAVERRIRDREVVGSSLGRTLRRKNSGQVSHTYG